MNAEKNILIAFILNIAFSMFEFFGGVYTGSVAIISDAIHDIGDAAGIGLSYLFEKKSRKQPDDSYTYGYTRYSVIGGAITTVILLVGSVTVICNAVRRIIFPTEIDYEGMIIFAVVGVCVNFCAAFFTRDGDSLNQKAVNLHMIEDVLGWVVVLIGAVVMKFTDFLMIDAVMSIGVAAFILINAIKNLKDITAIFLEKTPCNIEEIREIIKNMENVIDVHHIHVWSMDGQNNCATMHVVANTDSYGIKHKIKEQLHKHGICHVTIEFETEGEFCNETSCHMHCRKKSGHHHH